MATITPYVAVGTHVGQKQEVKAKKFIWIKVGEGSIDTFSDQEVAVNGKISILGYSGNLNIQLILTDQNPEAQEGSCTLRLNSHRDDNARYQAKNGRLTFYATLGGKKQNVTISRCNNGTQTECRLSGYVNETVHLDPTN
jgi:hypothetical protein